MTITNAIHVIEKWIEKKSQAKKDFLDPDKTWNNSELASLHELAHRLASLMNTEIDLLEIIKQELSIECKHPKKFRDVDPEGKTYCVGCNQDL